MASSAAEALARLGVAHAVAAWARGVEAQARRDADAALMEAHDALGAKNAEVTVCGVKVGTLSVATSKGRVAVSDASAWQACLRDLHDAGDPRVARRVAYDAQAVLDGAAVDDGRVVDPATGEELAGLAWVPGGEATGTRLGGCSAGKVAEALRAGGLDLAKAARMLDEGAPLALPGGGEG